MVKTLKRLFRKRYKKAVTVLSSKDARKPKKGLTGFMARAEYQSYLRYIPERCYKPTFREFINIQNIKIID